MQHKNGKRHTLCKIFLVILILFVLWVLWGNTALELNTYTIASTDLPERFDGYRIAHVSDLHNAQMGADNAALLEMLRDAQPDMIAITGDMIDARRTDMDVALRFAEEAVKIAPSYYVSGNHETVIAEYETFKAGLQACGVVVLEDEKLTLEQSGEEIVLIGLADPAFTMLDPNTLTREKLQQLKNEDRYTILLSHRPELFAVYQEYGIDLVLSGHTHGGQVRIPFVGGIIAPNQGWFPKYDAGWFKEGKTNLIISRGIGNSSVPLRFNNRPEVILITLHADV